MIGSRLIELASAPMLFVALAPVTAPVPAQVIMAPPSAPPESRRQSVAVPAGERLAGAAS